ncbi:MAG TPA: hypothetical protein VGH08_11585 [Chthoniobacterales bacterium]|jgi:hypothetical protein
MTTRVLAAGVLGGIAMFIWTSIAHMMLPLGEAGVREIPNEQAALAPLQQNIGDQSGLYLFPGLGVGPNPTREQRNHAMKHVAEKYAAYPSGFLVYHPPGRSLAFGKLLATEFATELLQAILAVWLLTQTRLVTFGHRVGFIFVIGIIASITTNISYWNWYGFPAIYTVSYIFVQIIGYLCVGLVAALLLRKASMELPGDALNYL